MKKDTKQKVLKVNKTVVIGSKAITENSIIHSVTKPVMGKKGNVLRHKVINYVQGLDSPLKQEHLQYLLENNWVDTTYVSTDYLDKYVTPDAELENRKKLKNKFIKLYPEYKDMMTTLTKWVFMTKGSPAVTATKEIKFQKNPKKVLAETKFYGGMKSKPGSPYKNRSTRQTPPSNVSGWESDSSTLLPNGIRKSDFCSFQECTKIFDKLIIEILGMCDVPLEFKDYWNSNGYFAKDTHCDYFYKTPISFNKFKQNTHHAKVKGLEICHINPDIEFTTFADNITIGLCESNRHQGGYSLDYTDKKILIKKIVDSKFNTNIEELLEMTIDELEVIYFKNKFQNIV